MALQLQDTINFISPFCRYQSPNVGTSNQPIIGIANLVRSIFLAAPFTWPFNRNTVSITGGLITTKQDYVQAISDFGFLERVVVFDGSTKYWEIPSVKNNESLSVTNTQARPQVIAVQNNDGQGNITFRLSTLPEQAYPTVNLVYQKAPVNFQSLSDLWGPIPDYYSDVFNNLCLGYYMDSCQDTRAREYISRGIAGLLARSTGLTQMDKALFAQSYMNFEAAQIIHLLKAQQGQQAQAAR